MTQVVEAARRIAARFKSCLGKTVPCSGACLCVSEAAKQLGVPDPQKKRVEPVEPVEPDQRVPLVTAEDIEKADAKQVADWLEFGGKIGLANVTNLIRRAVTLLRGM